MKKLVVIAFFLSLGTCFAQNLVPNPSFEDYTFLPTGEGEFDRVVDWTNASKNTQANPPIPDYYHVNATRIAVQLPNAYESAI